MLTELQDYYDKLSAVAREKVIYTLNHPIFPKNNYAILLKQLASGGSVGVFSEKRKVSKNFCDFGAFSIFC
jgi:hypothetical protein